MNNKKIIILVILFVAVAGFALTPATAAKVHKDKSSWGLYDEAYGKDKKYILLQFIHLMAQDKCL